MISIEQILEKASDTKALVIRKDAAEYVPSMFRKLFPGQKATVIADMNTYGIAGKEICSRLSDCDIEQAGPLILDDPDLFAEWHFLEQVESHLKNSGAIGIAVGSGVINDLVKLASEHIGKRYMVFGTAASMDGYTAYGASVSFEGNKQTFDCRAPYGILLDPAIAAAAPNELSASGYADLIAKVPAGADWMIADALDIEHIDPFSWEILNQTLKNALSSPEKIFRKDYEAIEKLAYLLIMSGFSMQAIQSSRPASGTEHQYSHCWDIENLCIDGKHVSHGFKVGIGTLVSTASLEFLINYDISRIDIAKCVGQWPSWEETESRIIALTGHNDGLKSRCLYETREKYTDRENLEKELRLFADRWPDLRQKLTKQILPYGYVKECLKKAGAPYEPEMIHISREHLRDTFRITPFMRSRFTNIDIIYRLGLMDELESRLFGKGGYYEI